MKNYTITRRTENAFGNDDCLRQPACFFRIRRGTFPYGVEDDASTISQTPTTHHYTNTCVKLTIVTYLSFSERIAIANISYCCNSCCCFSHSAGIGCQPEKTKKLLYTVANPARGLLNREKRTKEKVWQHTTPPPHTLLVRRKISKKSRDACLGRSRVRTRISSARRVGTIGYRPMCIRHPLLADRC